MRRVLRLLLAGLWLASIGLPAGLARAQTGETPPAPTPPPDVDLVARINASRVATGLLPLRASLELAAAAQRLSQDMAATGRVQHVGSDGSRPEERIAAAGYAAYGDGTLVFGENITATLEAGGPQAALDAWLADIPSRSNLTNPDFREIGTGAATGADGKSYFTAIFGARPNVLPVFINGDASETGSAPVTLSFTNETVQPLGAEGVIGQAVEVSISNQPGFGDATWRPWARTIPWELEPGEGLKTVYVQFRDGRGRTTGATASIMLSATAPTATATVPGEPGPQETPGPGTSLPPTSAPVSPGPTVPVPTPGGRLTPGPATPESTPESNAPASGRPVNNVPPALLAGVCGLQVVGLLLTGYVVFRKSE